MCFAKHIRLVKRRARITFAATLYIHVCASERVCRLAAQKREFCTLHSHQTTKRVRSERLRSQTVLHDASSHAMSSVWDDSDTDSSSEDDGPTLRQRRDKWRRLAESIRADVAPMVSRWGTRRSSCRWPMSYQRGQWPAPCRWLHWAVRVVVLPTRISSVDEHTRHRSCLSTCGVTPWVKG